LDRLRSLSALSIACLLLAGCNKFEHKKPDATKGVVTGTLLCADTGKPARFATVTLTAAPKPGEKSNDEAPLPASETTITDLDGRFRLEAVPPGHYYAFATLEGYLDPALGIDPAKLLALPSDHERHQFAIDQWKDHLKNVTVSVHKVADISLEIEPAAEISGTVSFDDGSPAIGMHFQLLRKTEKGEMATVGLPLMDTWSIHALSDGHGRYTLTNLPAGEYAVCTLMPSEAENTAPRVCLGNTFRKKESKTVKVQAGETASGADIEIPLSGTPSPVPSPRSPTATGSTTQRCACSMPTTARAHARPRSAKTEAFLSTMCRRANTFWRSPAQWTLCRRSPNQATAQSLLRRKHPTTSTTPTRKSRSPCSTTCPT
jgi:hypothetical protein